MATNQGLSGVINATDGVPITQRMGQQGDELSSFLHAQYYEQTVRKNTFYGSNGATPSVTTVALATTYTGLALINPATSGVNVVVNKVGLSFLVVFPAVSTVGLLVGYLASGVATYTAAASPGASSLIGSGQTPKAVCALSATLVGTPYLHTVFGSGLTGAATTAPQVPSFYDMEGSVILAPGAYCAIYTSTVCGAGAMAASFQWEEVPLIR
jgi:hypothetical protein